MSYEMDPSRYPTFFSSLMSCSESFRKSQENDPFASTSSSENWPARPSQRKFQKKSKLARAPRNWIISPVKEREPFKSDSSDSDNESSSYEVGDNESSSHEVGDNEFSSHEVGDNESSGHEVDDNESSGHEADDNESSSHEADDNESSSHEVDDNESSSHEEDHNESSSHEVDHNESSSHEEDHRNSYMEFLEKQFDEWMNENQGSDTDLSEPEDMFYLNMKNEVKRAIEKGPPRKKMKIDNCVMIQPLFHKNAMLLLMDHPASATLYRYVSVKVLSGTLSVHGYDLNSVNSPLRVFSSDSFGLVEIKTENSDSIWKNKQGFIKLSRKLKRITGSSEVMHEIMCRLMADSSNSTVVVLLERCIVQPRLLFVELYYPLVFKFNMSDNFKKKYKEIKNLKRTYCLPNSDSTIQFNEEVEDLAADILTALRISRLNNEHAPRVLIYGHHNTGKSALLRYLMNKTLSFISSLVYMDADPGHAEFTPPGVVSLFDVNKPVTGPSFAHQRIPFAMSFIGATSSELSPNMYNKSVARIAHMYHNIFPYEMLFVNTMSSDKGLSLEALKSVMKAVVPTILIEVVTGRDDSMFDYREYSRKRTRYYQIQHSIPKRLRNNLSAEDERSMSILSYLGRKEWRHEKPMYLNSFKTMCISWRKIPIYFFGKKVTPDRVIESINASFVALCSVHESLILKSTISTNPKTLREDPENKCIGFGIVRAVDEAKKLLYIITPLSLKELKDVNAIMKGNIMIPPPVFLEQPILDVPIPFTDAARIPLEEDTEEDQDSKLFVKRFGENMYK